MKISQRILFWTFLLGAALVLNAVMCMTAPLLSGPEPPRILEQTTVPVMLAAPPRLPEKKQPVRPKKIKQAVSKRPKIPKLAFTRHVQHESRPTLRFKAPSFKLAMNNQIAPGMQVSPPPPEGSPDFSPAGFNAGKIGFEVGELDTPPIPLHRARPVYPFKARRKGIAGKVTVRFLVTATGMVDKASIIEAVPEKIFDQSVLDCIAKWRFKPGIFQGDPVATWVVLPISFKL